HGAHHELPRDEDPDRRGRADARLRERDREHDREPHHAAEPHPERGAERVAEAAEAGPGRDEDHRGERELHRRREDERLSDADPIPEAAHDGDLYRPREAGYDSQRDRRSGHDGICTDASLWKRLNSLPSVSTQRADHP